MRHKERERWEMGREGGRGGVRHKEREREVGDGEREGGEGE